MANAMKTITVGRFDQAMKNYTVSREATVQDVLDKAGITLGRGEEVNKLTGAKVSLGSKPATGTTLVVTGNVKSGCY